MALEDYLVPSKSTVNICFRCQNACGGCSWSEVDPETGRPRFEPVPGWTAVPSGHYKTVRGKRKFIESHRITACPEFVPDEPRDRQVTGIGANDYEEEST